MTEVKCPMTDDSTSSPKVLDFGRNLLGFQNLEGLNQASEF